MFQARLVLYSGYVLLAAAIVVIALGLFGVYLEQGFSAVMETLSPFNVINFALTVAILAPGIFLISKGKQLVAKHHESPDDS